MKLEFSNLDENQTRFVLSDSNQAFANSLRRAMTSEVKTFALEDVRIYDNSSALFDEILAHRLGLIPLVTEYSGYVTRDACSCEGAGCSQCSVTFTMSIEGPCLVTSKDLISEDPVIKSVYDDIPIVKLEKDQKVVIEARAILNSGNEHVKWQPTTICGYKNYPVIRSDGNCDGCGHCVEGCPKGILHVLDGAVAVKEGMYEECSLCRLCEQACLNSGIGEKPAIHIEMDPTRFLFTMESTGSLPSVTIIKEGLLFLKSQSDNLLETLEDL